MDTEETQPAITPEPDRLTRFRAQIAQNARGWREFVQERTAHDPDLALEFTNLDRAVDFALHEPLAWDAGLELAAALWPVVDLRGYWVRWQAVLEATLPVCRQLDRPAAEAALLYQLCDTANTLGEPQAALTWGQAAQALYERLQDWPHLVRVLNLLSQVQVVLGHQSAAEGLAQEAMTLAARTADRATLAAALSQRGAVHLAREAWDAALRDFTEATALYAAVGDLHNQARTLHNQGEIHRFLTHWPDAEAHYRQATELLARVDDEIGAARSRLSLGVCLHYQGHTPAALALCQDVEATFRHAGDRPWLARALNNRGVFLSALGQYDGAALAYAACVTLHQANQDSVMVIDSLLNWTEVLGKAGHMTDSRDRFAQAGKFRARLETVPVWLDDHYQAVNQQIISNKQDGHDS